MKKTLMTPTQNADYFIHVTNFPLLLEQQLISQKNLYRFQLGNIRKNEE